MKKTKFISLLILATLASVIAGFFFAFVADTITFYGNDFYSENKADAIVVLTGGRNRVHEGLSLLRAGRAGTLILSGVGAVAGLDDIFFKQLTADERERIILEKKSASTYENAVEAKKLMKEKRFKSMLLVTSVYHMKRAVFIFNNVFGESLAITPQPVSSPNFDEKRWWSEKSLIMLGGEFFKYCWYWMFFLVE
ncbi:YdcF family protein [bacterium]|nr:MAG: YdcF family protein [bacterium]